MENINKKTQVAMCARHMCLSLLLAFMAPLMSVAQRHEVMDSEVRSLQVVAGNDWLGLPVVTLGGGRVVNISFDDLTHEYRRLAYKVEHCEADWSLSEQLFESDFVEGFASGLTIDDVEESINTNVLYTHYSLQVPNSRLRLKLSGNYRLTVYDDNNDQQPVLQACFMVVEPLVGVQMEMITNTDVDINQSHQQVNMSVSYGALPVNDPRQQVTTVVLQNRRWDDARVNVPPQFTMANGLRWEHCRDLIFNAGNEYHKFEILDTDHPTLGIDHMGWDGEQYHATVFANQPRVNYLYDKDANGAFYIRNSDNVENNRTCDYVQVHFELQTGGQLSNDVYLNGEWTRDSFLPDFKMDWDEETGVYRKTVELKQGYYSYQYLMLTSSGATAPLPSEGNFYQTENSYQALVYFREQGGRTDRLVGYGTIRN